MLLVVVQVGLDYELFKRNNSLICLWSTGITAAAGTRLAHHCQISLICIKLLCWMVRTIPSSHFVTTSAFYSHWVSYAPAANHDRFDNISSQISGIELRFPGPVIALVSRYLTN